jgi:hypothetical protein
MTAVPEITLKSWLVKKLRREARRLGISAEELLEVIVSHGLDRKKWKRVAISIPGENRWYFELINPLYPSESEQAARERQEAVNVRYRREQEKRVLKVV